MVVNISYIEHSIPFDSNNLWITAEPNYKNTDISWDKLPEFIANSCIQYSHFYWTNQHKQSANWNNDKQNIIIFDFDDGMSIKEIQEEFKEYSYIISTTKSHQVLKKGLKCDRFRLILQSDNIPKGELFFSMMEVFENTLPIDKQVNTKTGAFLGCSNAITYTNVGKKLDCTKAIDLAEYMLIQKTKKEFLDKLNRKPKEDIVFDSKLCVQSLKDTLKLEDILELLEELGFEVIKDKFKLRPDERTPSAKVYPSGMIIDYGSGWRGDIFDVIQENSDMDLPQAIKFVREFLGEVNE